jgi:hypothetical protein
MIFLSIGGEMVSYLEFRRELAQYDAIINRGRNGYLE